MSTPFTPAAGFTSAGALPYRYVPFMCAEPLCQVGFGSVSINLQPRAERHEHRFLRCFIPMPPSSGLLREPRKRLDVRPIRTLQFGSGFGAVALTHYPVPQRIFEIHEPTGGRIFL